MNNYKVGRFMRKSSYCFQCVLPLQFYPSVTQVDQAKMVQAKIAKSSPSATRKTLVSGTIKLFHEFKEVTPNKGTK